VSFTVGKGRVTQRRREHLDRSASESPVGEAVVTDLYRSSPEQVTK
jgi:hypothetical protein